MAVVFLTGATGFIGKEVMRQLIEKGHEVMGLVRSLEKWERLTDGFTAEQKSRMIPIRGDLSKQQLGMEAELRAKLIERTEVVVHTAAPMDIDLKLDEARRNILAGTHELIALLQEMSQKGPLHHIIHVVGYMSPFREHGAIKTALDEKTFLPTASPYERFKFMADYLIRQEAELMGVALSVVNPPTVIGPRHTGSTEQLVGFGLLVDATRRGMMPVVPGGRDHWLPLIALDDLGRLIAEVVSEPKKNGDTYFALADRHESWNMTEMLEVVARELSVKAPRLSVSTSMLSKLLRWGGKLTGGLSANSLDFITDQSFPVESVTQLRKHISMGPLDVREILPYVVADLDYRYSGGTMPDGWKRERIGDLAALVREDGEDETWVFLHGAYSDANQMEPLGRQLAGKSVWLLDLPGFGRSPLHHHDDWLEGCVQAVAKALQKSTRPVHLVGHSFGGLVASRVARLLPQQVAHLYLLQPAMQPSRKPPLSVRMATRFPLLTKMLSSTEQVKKMLVASSAFEREADIPADYAACVLGQTKSPRMRKANALSLKAIHSLAFHQQGRGEWGKGWGDNYTILWGVRDGAYRVPETGAKVISLPYGHQFPLTHPRETAELLLNAPGKAL